MFWSGNYIAVRELNSLLKEENVTLSQVLEADDILQECKADNKALMMFLTRPDILSELITLITEEPSKDVELSLQYRHANIACEVLTSHLSMLSDRLSLDTVQMNRLCDFVARDPPLNPLLASYFSKTVKMLLERSSKQDWYLYHIVCLRVLDFFKSRRDFLPNLLRHMATSAIADVFKCFIRLDDLFNKIVMEWLDEHQFLESLIQITCGSYVSADDEKGTRDASEKDAPEDEETRERRRRAERRAGVAADNAGGLLLGLAWGGGGGETGGVATSRALAARLGGGAALSALLAGAATAPAAARGRAQALAAALLHALLRTHEAGDGSRSGVELAVAPHLPLLHRALLQADEPARVGAARVQVAALVALLAASDVSEVCSTLLTLGTPNVLLDMLEQFPQNNFLHAAVLAMIRNALNNPAYRTQYMEHLFCECDMLTRLMDLFERNEDRAAGCRLAHAGHVSLALLAAAGAARAAPPRAPPTVMDRFNAFIDKKLTPLQQMLDTPLGGTFPQENLFEVDNMVDNLVPDYDFNYLSTAPNMDDISDEPSGDNDNENEMGLADGHVDSAEFIADGLGFDDADEPCDEAERKFAALASRRLQEAGAGGAGAGWDEAGFAPWGGAAAAAPDGWAQFERDPDELQPFWGYDEPPELPERLAAASLHDALASNLLTAMSNMSPDALSSLQASLDQPGQADHPRQPDQPGQSDHPGQPDQPGQSDHPGQPDQPGQSEPPEQTGRLDHPAVNHVDHQGDGQPDIESNEVLDDVKPVSEVIVTPVSDVTAKITSEVTTESGDNVASNVTKLESKEETSASVAQDSPVPEVKNSSSEVPIVKDVVTTQVNEITGTKDVAEVKEVTTATEMKDVTEVKNTPEAKTSTDITAPLESSESPGTVVETPTLEVKSSLAESAEVEKSPVDAVGTSSVVVVETAYEAKEENSVTEAVVEESVESRDVGESSAEAAEDDSSR